jgi:hypothetical protein
MSMDIVQFIDGVRVEYNRENDMWWAHANINFSAAADTLPELQQQVHDALKEIFEAKTTVEVIKDYDYPPRLRNTSNG